MATDGPQPEETASTPNPAPPQSNLEAVANDQQEAPVATAPDAPSSSQPTSQSEPSSQPPAPEPQSLAPQPEPAIPGPRATRLQQVYTSTLRQTLSKLSYPNIESCYPTIASRAPNILKSIQSQMVSVLESKCQREFEHILARMRVVQGLNDLEQLLARAEGRRREHPGQEAPVAPHLLPPDQVLAAHLAPHLASQQSQLNAKLQTVQSHNLALFEEIRRQREEARRMLDAVERVLADVAGANGLLDEVAGDLATESRGVEVEMMGEKGAM